MKSHEGLLPCMFPHEVKRGVFLDIDDEDCGIIRGACSDCGACGPYVGIETTKATDEERREAVRLWNALARTPSPSGAREAIEQVISAWAFAYGIDGAARNDLFRRLATISEGM